MRATVNLSVISVIPTFFIDSLNVSAVQSHRILRYSDFPILLNFIKFSAMFFAARLPSFIRRLLLTLSGFLFVWQVLASSVAHAESDYYRFEIDEDALSGAPDFSNMNHSITDADKIFVKAAHFYRVGIDGRANTKDDTRVRLFGISLSSAANFPLEADAPRIAKRLRKMGFNAVRLHHLDSILSDDEVKPRGILTTGAFPTFNATAINRLRVFIDALKAEGIYVNLNLHVGYTFRPAVDGVTPLSPGEQMPFASHPLHLFEPKMISLQVEYARRLIRRLALNNDPALAMIEINNESSLLGAWQRGYLDHLKGEYERLLQLQWQHWAARQYGSPAQACQLWQSCDLTKQGGLLVKAGESSVLEGEYGWAAKMRTLARRGLNKIGVASPDLLGHSFEPHPQGAGKRVLDFTRFLVDMDKQYLDIMRRTVRAEVGDLVPLTGTQMYYGGVMNADAQQSMDYVDEHFYVDHYDFPHQAWDRNDWRIRDQSALKEAWPQLLQRAYFRDVNKPFVLSEFNQAYPNRQGAEILPVMAAFASAQDWDGLFFFQYIDGDTWKSVPDSFSLSGDWAKYATAGTSAALFRQFQIKPLAERKTILLSADIRQMLGALRDESAYPAYLLSRFGIAPKTAFLYRLGVNNVAKADVPTNAVAQSQAEDSVMWQGQQGQGTSLRYQSTLGQLSASTPYSLIWAGFGEESRGGSIQSAINFSSYDSSTTAEISVSFPSGSRRFATILATSRDGLSLANSKRILLTVASVALGNQPNAIPARPKKLIPYLSGLSVAGQYGGSWWTLEPDPDTGNKPSGPRDSQAPVWLERIPMVMFYPSKCKIIQVFPLDGSGKRRSALPATAIKKVIGGFELQLGLSNLGQSEQLSPWFELIVE